MDIPTRQEPRIGAEWCLLTLPLGNPRQAANIPSTRWLVRNGFQKLYGRAPSLPRAAHGDWTHCQCVWRRGQEGHTLAFNLVCALTACISHAGRAITQSLEKGKAHVLLYPLPQLQHVEDLLLGCEGRDCLLNPSFLVCGCSVDLDARELTGMSVRPTSDCTCDVIGCSSCPFVPMV